MVIFGQVVLLFIIETIITRDLTGAICPHQGNELIPETTCWCLADQWRVTGFIFYAYGLGWTRL